MMKIKNFNSNVFYLGGWVSPPSEHYGNGKDFLNDQVFKDVKESGVNVLYTNIDRLKHLDDLKRMALCAEKAGVYLVIGDDTFCNEKELKEEDTKAFFDFCNNSKAVIGIDFADEPGYLKFDKLKEVFNLCKQYKNNLFYYVNLLPMYAFQQHILGIPCKESELRHPTNTEYKKYLDDFLDKVPVDSLSFDYYPFLHEKGNIKETYFLNLSICRKSAIEHNLPLWNFIQVTSFNKKQIRTMTYPEILWLVNTSICYGVTGIQYFCYWTPFDINGESFDNAMIDRDGNKTESYYFVQKINKKIQYYAPHILSSNYKGIIGIGDTIAKIPEEDNLVSFGNIEKIDSTGVIIGCFEKNNKDTYYLMNTSLFDKKEIKISFKKTMLFDVLENQTTKEYNSKDRVFNLEPGDSVLIIEK